MKWYMQSLLLHCINGPQMECNSHLVTDKLVRTVIQTHQLGNPCLRLQSAPLKVWLNFIPKARDRHLSKSRTRDPTIWHGHGECERTYLGKEFKNLALAQHSNHQPHVWKNTNPNHIHTTHQSHSIQQLSESVVVVPMAEAEQQQRRNGWPSPKFA